MKILKTPLALKIILITAFLLGVFQTYSQNNGSCATALPICSDMQNIPSITGSGYAENGPYYGCLTLQPRPRWYYMQVSEPGLLQFDLSQYNTAGNGIDIDFIVWGPFSSMNNVCEQLTEQKMVDCSYSTSAFETVTIPNVEVGEFYVLMVTNFNGSSGTWNLTPTPNNTAATDCNIICDVELIGNNCSIPSTLTAQTSSNVEVINYQWFYEGSNIATTQPPNNFITATQAGLYTVSIAVNNPFTNTDCISSDQITMAYLPIENRQYEICENQSLNISYDPLPNATYHWYLTPIGGSPFFIGNELTTGALTDHTTYYIELVQGNCRSLRGNIEITVIPMPNAGILQTTQTLCEGDTTMVVATGDSGGSYSSSQPNVASINSQTGELIAIQAGNSTIRYSLTNMAPCPDVFTEIEIQVIRPPDAGEDASLSLCTYDEPLDLRLSLNGNPDLNGYWTPPLNSGTHLFNPSVDTSGNYIYTVTGNSPCPDDSSSILVTVNTPPNAGIDSAIELCNTQEPIDLFQVLLDNPDSGGSWEPPLPSGSGVFNPATDAPGTYTYTVSGIWPCNNESSEVQVIVHQQPYAGENAELKICLNEEPFDLFSLLGNADEGGEWTPALSSGNNYFDPNIDSSGTYTYTVYGIPPCVDSSVNVEVEVLPLPILYNAEYGNGSITLYGAEAVAPYQYNINGGEYTFENEFYLPTGMYYFSVLSANGCTCERVELPIIAFPNVFTPNNDGINDTWDIHRIEFLQNAHVQVFDRYGKLVYEKFPSTDFVWDGKYLGRSLPSATYWYIITFDSYSGSKSQLKGYVTLKNRNSQN